MNKDSIPVADGGLFFLQGEGRSRKFALFWRSSGLGCCPRCPLGQAHVSPKENESLKF